MGALLLEGSAAVGEEGASVPTSVLVVSPLSTVGVFPAALLSAVSSGSASAVSPERALRGFTTCAMVSCRLS